MSPPGTVPPLPPLAWRLPRRYPGLEILDGDEFSPAELTRSLRAMTWVNRKLGALPPVAAAIRELGRSRVSLLDVGTGTGAFPTLLARRLKTGGITLEWTGVDRSRKVIGVAARPAEASPGDPPPSLLVADALHLPFPADAFDVVFSSLTLHHLTDEDAQASLREMARVARHRILVSDLERHPLHYAGARLLSSTLWRTDRVTRVDGPISVLRSFTRTEIEELAQDAGLARVRVRRSFPFRLLMLGDPPIEAAR